MKVDVSGVNALAELERAGWKYEPMGSDEVKLCCPAHDDKTPSAVLNVAKNVFRCFAAGCKASGDVITLLGLMLQVERATIIADLTTRYDIEGVKSISPETIEQHHARIFTEAGPLLTALRDRGITDEMIRRARLGYHNGRIVIPVYDAQGRIVNMRRYLPGAPGPQKMKNTPGYGRMRLYQVDQVARYSKVWICGGEMKALVVGGLLNNHGVGATAVSGGEGEWDVRWNALFKDKEVFVCMDVDAHGETAVESVSRLIARDVKTCRIIKLPLDREKYPKGDVNDLVGKEGADATVLLKLQDESKVWAPRTTRQRANLPPINTTLVGALRNKQVGVRLRAEGLVSAFFETPYLLPHEVTCICDRKQKCCSVCPVYTVPESPDSGGIEQTLPTTSQALLGMIEAPAKVRRGLTMDALGIPESCGSVQFVERKAMTVYDARVSPQLTLTGQSGGSIVRHPAYIVNKQVDSNVPYVFTGALMSHPRTGQAAFLFDEAKEAQDSLESFCPTEHELLELERFSPREWSMAGLEDKLKEIYDDLAVSVTRIFGRQSMHLLLDLAFFSPLLFTIDGQVVRGWTNVLLLGDSGQGKTEASSRMIEHYGCGERVVCKNASTAGLVGGLQQIGSRWFASFGVIPQQDRRLVILEEFKGLAVEEIGRMTDMRSSGIAEIPKIERGKANARTRLVCVSNPRQPRNVSSYSYGVDTIVELIGAMEDVRRFDLAEIVTKQQVHPNIVARSKGRMPDTPALVTKELCHRGVLFAWTRDADQVRFEPQAVEAVYDEAASLCNQFTDEIPLIDRGTTHQKIMRLAAALAARTYSHSEPDDILVRECHVRYIARHMRLTYDDPSFGYGELSRLRMSAEKLENDADVRHQLMNSRYPRDIVHGLLDAKEILPDDIMALYGIDRDSAMGVISFMVRRRCIKREGRGYRKTDKFSALLRTLAAQGLPEGVEAGPDEKDF